MPDGRCFQLNVAELSTFHIPNGEMCKTCPKRCAATNTHATALIGTFLSMAYRLLITKNLGWRDRPNQ